jgi:hypothetical protein
MVVTEEGTRCSTFTGVLLGGLTTLPEPAWDLFPFPPFFAEDDADVDVDDDKRCSFLTLLASVFLLFLWGEPMVPYPGGVFCLPVLSTLVRESDFMNKVCWLFFVQRDAKFTIALPQLPQHD